jgi:hypothetical protein
MKSPFCVGKPLAAVVCPVVGCGRTLPQGELEAHLSGSLLKHLQLMSVATQVCKGGQRHQL